MQNCVQISKSLVPQKKTDVLILVDKFFKKNLKKDYSLWKLHIPSTSPMITWDCRKQILPWLSVYRVCVHVRILDWKLFSLTVVDIACQTSIFVVDIFQTIPLQLQTLWRSFHKIHWIYHFKCYLFVRQMKKKYKTN